LNCNIAGREFVGRGFSRGLARDQATPRLVAFMDDLGSVFLVFGLTGECESVLGFSIGDFIDPEPFVGSSNKAREMALNILDVVQLGRKGILHVDHDDLPVGLAFVKEGHDTKDLDLLDLTNIADLLADLANVERIVVSLGLGFSVRLSRVFPGLREGAIVPDVPVVREAVANVSQPTLLNILLDWVEGFLLGDLHLRVGPARDLNDHVEDAIVLVSEERNVVEGRNNGSVLFNEHTMFKSVGRANKARGVLRSHALDWAE